jgi:transposase-like protein
MTKPFSTALKQQMVARLTGVNALSAAQLARETGITQQSLSRWLNEAQMRPWGFADEGNMPSTTVEQKARILAQAAQLATDDLTAYLEKEGVKPAHYRHWRQALEESGEQSVAMTKRIRRLERELVRKERALAEAATLLLLRDTMEGSMETEVDESDGRVEKPEELNC